MQQIVQFSNDIACDPSHSLFAALPPPTITWLGSFFTRCLDISAENLQSPVSTVLCSLLTTLSNVSDSPEGYNIIERHLFPDSPGCDFILKQIIRVVQLQNPKCLESAITFLQQLSRGSPRAREIVKSRTIIPLLQPAISFALSSCQPSLISQLLEYFASLTTFVTTEVMVLLPTYQPLFQHILPAIRDISSPLHKTLSSVLFALFQYAPQNVFTLSIAISLNIALYECTYSVGEVRIFDYMMRASGAAGTIHKYQFFNADARLRLRYKKWLVHVDEEGYRDVTEASLTRIVYRNRDGVHFDVASRIHADNFRQKPAHVIL
ncbi:hypothetical protein BLNAU_4562 [Blattamonas nauphoetae]|uniref:Uncharacterized protein n=1 Tax=Blattamonas nauphoetae TaxID=2049346 RepID=A0ABQ9Y9E1_9EUKA|nr:hypothetical protein BLNAU_4562 [Blattamonas nauphoetae]